MNFYTYFKNESKSVYKDISKNYPSDYLLSRGINSLASYRNNMLRFAFGFDSLDVSHFQIACYRVVPTDFPKSFYENLYDFLFCSTFRNSVSDAEYEEAIDCDTKLTSELCSILGSRNV